MRIILTKTSDARHTLEVVRDDGSSSRIELETRSFFVHDLAHYVVEGCAGLSEGFWGALAAGKTWDDLNDRTGKRMQDAGPARAASTRPEGPMAAIEGVVGPLQNALRGRTDPAETLEGIRRYFADVGNPLPPWLTLELVVAAAERLRRITGEWKALPFRGSMELRWPPAKKG